MQVTLDIPEDLALEGLRTGKLTVAQARRFLGVASRYEMDGFLKARNIMLPLTVEDVERDAETVRLFLGR